MIEAQVKCRTNRRRSVVCDRFDALLQRNDFT
jgi:hypothetical protein